MRMLLLLHVFFFLHACGPRPSAESQLFHNINEPIRSNYLWNWFPFTKPEDIRLILQRLAISEAKSQNILRHRIAYLRHNDPATLQLQQIYDRLDEKIREVFTLEQKLIPSPKILIRVDDALDAAVVPAHVCFVGPKFLFAGAKSPVKEIATTYLAWEGGLRDFHEEPCKEVKLSDVDYPGFVAWITENVRHCSVSHKNDHEIVLSTECQRDRSFAPTSTKRLAMQVTGSHIIVKSGLVKSMSASELVSVLAHEAAHYYRSHATAATEGADYNFFYQLDARDNLAKRPEPNVAFDELGKKVLDAKVPNLYYRRVADQKIPSELFKPIAMILHNVAALQSAEYGTLCTDTNIWLKKPEIKAALDGFPMRVLTAKQIATYLEFENRSIRCLQDLEVTPTVTFVEGKKINPAIIKSALASDSVLYKATWAKFAIAEKNAWDVLKDAEAFMTRAVHQIIAPLQVASEQRLGYYSYEQEADEYGLEWSYDIGLEVADLSAALLKFAEVQEKKRVTDGFSALPFELGENRCRELLRQGWLDEQGAPVFVPVADYQSQHPSSCFRVYNLAREVKAHAFIDSRVDPVDGEIYRDLVQWLEDAGQRAMEVRP